MRLRVFQRIDSKIKEEHLLSTLEEAAHLVENRINSIRNFLIMI